MRIERRQSRSVRIGTVPVGGDAPISIQSMTNTDTRDVAATVGQILRMEAHGCDLVSCAVVDRQAAAALEAIIRQIHVPLVADIHFDHNLALAALSAGVHKIRINPGNIGSREKARRVVEEAKARQVPIRIGVNAGSLERDILKKHGHPTAAALVESAMRHVTLLEEMDFYDIVISLKASDVPTTVAAYRDMARRVPYPLHLGVTEAGTLSTGTVVSAIGIGALLLDGIGDTLRVSLTAPPEKEVDAGFEILKALGIRQRGPRFSSCPACGRTTVDLIAVTEAVEKELADVQAPIQIAVMGCEVNGPGEAAEADIGLACGKAGSLILQKGRIIKKISNDHLVAAFVAEVRRFLAESQAK